MDTIPHASEMAQRSDSAPRGAPLRERVLTALRNARAGNNGQGFVDIDNYGNDPERSVVTPELLASGYTVEYPFRDGSICARIGWQEHLPR